MEAVGDGVARGSRLCPAGSSGRWRGRQRGQASGCREWRQKWEGLVSLSLPLAVIMAFEEDELYRQVFRRAGVFTGFKPRVQSANARMRGQRDVGLSRPVRSGCFSVRCLPAMSGYYKQTYVPQDNFSHRTSASSAGSSQRNAQSRWTRMYRISLLPISHPVPEDAGNRQRQVRDRTNSQNHIANMQGMTHGYCLLYPTCLHSIGNGNIEEYRYRDHKRVQNGVKTKFEP